MDEQEAKNLVKVWWAKAGSEKELGVQFYLYWICFNIWLDYRSYGERMTEKEKKERRDSDKKMIRWLQSDKAQNSDLRTKYDQLKMKPHFQTCLQGLVRNAPIRDPRYPDEGIHIKDINDFSNIVEGIYQIRCNLFHGKQQLQETKLISIAKDILSQWVTGIMSTWN